MISKTHIPISHAHMVFNTLYDDDSTTKKNLILKLIESINTDDERTIYSKITNGELRTNSSCLFPQTLTRGQVIAWCAVYHAKNGNKPESIQQLQEFINCKYKTSNFSFEGGRAQTYLNEYKNDDNYNGALFGTQSYNYKKIQECAQKKYKSSNQNSDEIFAKEVSCKPIQDNDIKSPKNSHQPIINGLQNILNEQVQPSKELVATTPYNKELQTTSAPFLLTYNNKPVATVTHIRQELSSSTYYKITIPAEYIVNLSYLSKITEKFMRYLDTNGYNYEISTQKTLQDATQIFYLTVSSKSKHGMLSGRDDASSPIIATKSTSISTSTTPEYTFYNNPTEILNAQNNSEQTKVEPQSPLQNNTKDSAVDAIEINATNIQKIIRLVMLWRKFLAEPKKTYSTFSNDKVANKMFGSHVAQHANTKAYISKQRKYNRDYYRDVDRNEKSTFKMLPNTDLDVALEGSCKTMWENSIEKFKDNRFSSTKTTEAQKILSKYAQNSEALLNSKELAQLQRIPTRNKHKKSNFVHHAKELYKIIETVCKRIKSVNIPETDKERIQDNFARLHLFLTILVTLHNDQHTKFVAMLEPVIHELSLLIYEISIFNDKPVVEYTEFNQSTQREFANHILGIENIEKKYPETSICGYPANSGMHANTLGLYIAKKILGINEDNKKEFTYKITGELYYETKNSLLYNMGNRNADDFAHTHILNSSIMDVYTPYFAGTNLEHYITNMVKLDDNRHSIVVTDITNNDYNTLKLNETIMQNINEGKLSIIFWESWQKYGLLGTDQAQFGRVVALTNNQRVEQLKDINEGAEIDIKKIDMQIGALFQLSREDYNQYRMMNFENGKTLRDIFGNSNQSSKVGPFLNANGYSNIIQSFEYFITSRDSFGFNCTTYTKDAFSSTRVSAGTEPNIDIEILAMALKKMGGRDINNYFNNLTYPFNIEHLKSELITKELIAYMMVILVNLNSKNANQYTKNLTTIDKIIEICDVIIKDPGTEHYKRIFGDFLDNSNKSLNIIIQVRTALRKIMNTKMK